MHDMLEGLDADGVPALYPYLRDGRVSKYLIHIDASAVFGISDPA
jgi:hypothetical protein